MARTATAEQATETQAPPPGHNGPSEETFREHLRKIIAANDVLDQAKSARQAVRKLAKAAGLELKKLDAVITMADWEPGEVREHFGTLHQYAIWMGLPVGSQLDLFDGVPDASKPTLDWEAKGFVAATTGKGEFGKAPDNCPADNVQDYMRGWSRGQAANAPAQLDS